MRAHTSTSTASTSTIDRIPRYVPEHVIIARAMRLCPVTQTIAYPPGQHPAGCPLVADCTAIEARTEHGSRWYGAEHAYINAELRMVAIGFDARDEVRRQWAIVPEEA